MKIQYHTLEIYTISIVTKNNPLKGCFYRVNIEEQKALSPTSIRIHMSTDGTNLQLFSDKKSSSRERDQLNILKDLLANWAFPVQSDTVGAYSATFSSLDGKSGFLQKAKRKLLYLASAVAPEILHSENIMLWDMALGIPHSVRGVEELRLGKSASGIKTKSIYSIDFDHQAKGIGISAKELAGLRSKDSLLLVASTDKSDHPDFNGINWEVVSNDLRRIQTLSKSERLKVFGDLTYLLRSQESLLPQLTTLLTPDIIAQGASSALFSTIVGGLATVATPAMQAALVALYEDQNASVMAKGGVLSALTTTQATLDDTTKSFLENTMKTESNSDLAQGAGFALGASLQNASSSPAVDTAIASIQAEWNALQSNPNLGRELALLDTMGNSGRVEFYSDINSVINSASDSLARAKAVFSLRYYTTSAAVSTLSVSLQDADPKVRTAAVQAMQIAPWNEAFRGSLQKCSTSEVLSSLQNACTTVLMQAATHVSSL